METETKDTRMDLSREEEGYHEQQQEEYERREELYDNQLISTFTNGGSYETF